MNFVNKQQQDNIEPNNNNNNKRQKMEGKKIGTHSGSFHCDEALACYMLRLTPEYQNAEIIRSRDPEVLNTLDILVDVGGEYDVVRNRFDHHQRGFTETFDENHDIKLSSAGLIYKHFGKQIIKQTLDTDEDTTELVYQQLYKNFVEALDAIDNGISQYPSDIQPRYISKTDLPSRVGHLNPSWNEELSSTKLQEQFEKAVNMAGTEFMNSMQNIKNVWLPARSIVEKALVSRNELFQSTNSEIMILDHFCPWQSHLVDLEKEKDVKVPLKYVLYADTNGSWRIHAVAVALGSFESRLPLPEPWRGLRDDVLSQACGIDGCIFIHASGFIGGHKTREGAIALAQKALDFHKNN